MRERILMLNKHSGVFVILIHLRALGVIRG